MLLWSPNFSAWMVVVSATTGLFSGSRVLGAASFVIHQHGHVEHSTSSTTWTNSLQRRHANPPPPLNVETSQNQAKNKEKDQVSSTWLRKEDQLNQEKFLADLDAAWPWMSSSPKTTPPTTSTSTNTKDRILKLNHYSNMLSAQYETTSTTVLVSDYNNEQKLNVYEAATLRLQILAAKGRVLQEKYDLEVQDFRAKGCWETVTGPSTTAFMTHPNWILLGLTLMGMLAVSSNLVTDDFSLAQLEEWNTIAQDVLSKLPQSVDVNLEALAVNMNTLVEQLKALDMLSGTSSVIGNLAVDWTDFEQQLHTTMSKLEGAITMDRVTQFTAPFQQQWEESMTGTIDAVQEAKTAMESTTTLWTQQAQDVEKALATQTVALQELVEQQQASITDQVHNLQSQIMSTWNDIITSSSGAMQKTLEEQGNGLAQQIANWQDMVQSQITAASSSFDGADSIVPKTVSSAAVQDAAERLH